MFKQNANILCNNDLFNPASMAFMPADDFDRLFHAVKTLHPRARVTGPSALARFLGESPQVMNAWRGRGLPSAKLSALAQKVGCRREYLEFGELPMTTDEAMEAEPAPRAKDDAEDRNAAALDLHLAALRQTAKGVADTFGMTMEEVLAEIGAAGKVRLAGKPKTAVTGVRVIDSNKPIPSGRLSLLARTDARSKKGDAQ